MKAVGNGIFSLRKLDSLRDTGKREVDRTEIPRYYQVHAGEADFEKSGIRVIPVHTFCEELRLP